MKTIAIDVDGVVADLLTVWLARYNKDAHDHLKSEDIREWGIEQYVKPKWESKIFDYLEDPSLYNEVTVYPGAMMAVKWLQERARVVFVTTCAKNAMTAKYNWLGRHGLVGGLKDYVVCADKGLIRADALIDDGFHNIKKFVGTAYMLVQPWNHKIPWEHRIESWGHFNVHTHPWEGLE